MYHQKSIKVNELELKILDINPLIVEDRIIALGGEKVLDTFTYTTFFDTTFNINNEFLNPNFIELLIEINRLTEKKLSLRSQNIFLRIRKQGSRHELTLKYSSGTSSSVKSSIELSFHLDELQWSRIEEDLIHSGFMVIARHEKKRVSYDCKTLDLHLDIDTLPQIPSYIEIEGGSESSIFNALEYLDLKSHLISTESGENFLKRYGVEFYSHLKF